MNASIQRKTDVIREAAKKAPEALQPYIDKAAPVVAVIVTAAVMIVPYIIKFYGLIFKLYEFLEPYHPEDLLEFFVGFFMCFFGGTYPALITTCEAYRQIGWEPTVKALRLLYADAEKVAKEMKKDDKKDEDNDGIADVNQISAGELVERKFLLMAKTTDPIVCSDAMTAISAGWLAVLASLKISFAKAITLGSAIGDILRKPALRFIAPAAKKVIPEDYSKWIIPGITYICKAIAVSIAWTLQRIISAFYSALRGGEMAGKALVKYLHKYGVLKSNSSEDTLIDEAVGYSLMILGLLVQLGTGFRLPFPLNVILFPFSIIETLIVWTVM